MERIESEAEYLQELTDLLDDSSMSEIDFDQVKVRLLEISSTLQAEEVLASELALLREDCQGRIAGMVKAIAAVDRVADRREEALETIEELPSLPAEQLLRQYRRVAARFRDFFPTSFGRTIPAAPALARASARMTTNRATSR